MGDLARFVAAALRDKVMEELQEENKRLETENRRLQSENKHFHTMAMARMADIEITGPNGMPMYAAYDFLRTPYDQLTVRPLGGDSLHGRYTRSCPASQLLDAELHIRRIGRYITFREIVQKGHWTCTNMSSRGDFFFENNELDTCIGGVDITHPGIITQQATNAFLEAVNNPNESNVKVFTSEENNAGHVIEFGMVKLTVQEDSFLTEA